MAIRRIIILFLLISKISFGAPPFMNQQLRVYLDWFPNIEFAGMYVAQKHGWYTEAGIDLKMVYNGLDIVPNVLSGQADIGMHSAHDLIRHIGNGAKIKAFAAQYQLNPNSIIVRKGAGISSIKDLKGKTLGIFSPQEYDIYRVMLGFHGLSLEDIKFKSITTFKELELIDILKKKEVDGFIAWEFNWTVTFSLLGYEVVVFPGYENGFNFYGTVFFAPTEYVSKHKELLKKFLQITFRGWREVYKNPEVYCSQVVDNIYPKDRYINGSRDITYKQQLLEIKLRKRYLFEGVGEKKIGQMSVFKWQKSLDIANATGMLPKGNTVKVTDIFDSTIWMSQ